MEELCMKSWAEFYERRYSEKSCEQSVAEATSIIKASNPEARRVLELACSTGRYTKYLVGAGFMVMATDVSADAVNIAKKSGVSATFDVLDMRDLDMADCFDAVMCFNESFRYMRSYSDCRYTLGRISKALHSKGLFICDFMHFPEFIGSRPVVLAPRIVDMGEGLVIIQETTLFADGDFDERRDKMTFVKNGSVEKVQVIKREPLLKIGESLMKEMLEGAGFKVLEMRRGFAGTEESILFVAKKTS